MLFSDSYFESENDTEGVFKNKGSRFLAYAFRVFSEDDIKTKLALLRKQYPDATHHCYAYILGHQSLLFRANDDGEPGNTAGQPILREIRKTGLTNMLVVVVRYFGGTMLGVPGLIEAYGAAAAECLNKCIRVEKKISELYRLACNFGIENEVYQLCRQFNVVANVKPDMQQFVAEVAVPLLSAEAFKKKASELYRIQLDYIGIT